jgi:hypothetical protein
VPSHQLGPPLCHCATVPLSFSTALDRLMRAAMNVWAAELLLAQCKYIYGDGLPDTSQAVNAFNARFGGSAPQNMNASKVLFLRYSDDPWQPAQPVTSLSPELPLILTQSAQGGRNGSCAHCGAGCTPEDIARLNVAQAKQVRAWLKP